MSVHAPAKHGEVLHTFKPSSHAAISHANRAVWMHACAVFSHVFVCTIGTLHMTVMTRRYSTSVCPIGHATDHIDTHRGLHTHSTIKTRIQTQSRMHQMTDIMRCTLAVAES